MSFSFRNRINVGFSLAFVFVLVISIVSYRNTNLLTENAAWVARSHEVAEMSELAVSQLKDLETGQRGFLVTGQEEYLEPYHAALNTIDGTLSKLQELTSDNINQQRAVEELRKLKSEKIAELTKTIQLRREKGFKAAQDEVLTDTGRALMDSFRKITAQMKDEEARLLNAHNKVAAEGARTTLFVILFGNSLALLILLGAIIVINISEGARARASQKLEDQSQIREGLIQLNARMGGEQSIPSLAHNVIECLATFVKAAVGAIYFCDEGGVTKLVGGYAFHGDENSLPAFKPGESLVGQAAQQKEPIFLTDVPKDYYLKVSSGLGETRPKALYIVPFLHEGTVKGVIELGSFLPLKETQLEYLKLSLDSIAVASNSAQIRFQVADLLQKTQLQTEELQAQQEELKTGNEELEEKTNELQTQQEELKQANEELEETTVALEEEKEKFRLMISGVKDYAILMLDREGNVVTWNEGAERIKGYKESEILGKHFSIFYTPEARNQHHPEFELNAAAEKGVYEEEGIRVRKDGSQFWSNVVITALYDRNRQLRGFTKVTRDITERKRAEIALQMANKYKSEFLANMSHELRTPLNSILLLSKSLSENSEHNLTLNQQESGQMIHSAGTDLLNLINDILDLSKVEAGKLDIKSEQVEVSELAGAMGSLFKPQMKAKGLSFEVSTSKDCPESIATDRLRLEQILKNFLSNALKFTSSGGVTLAFTTPSAEMVDERWRPESSIAISVIDTGIGIPEGKKHLIFEAFEQVDSSVTRKYGGTGLGLTIARELAALLGGEIRVKSEEGKGSTFTLLIPRVLSKDTPVKEVVPAQKHPIDMSQERVVQVKPPRRQTDIADDRETIEKGDRVMLIIEDDPQFAKILIGFCRDRGFKCLFAPDGESGLTDARELRPDAIVLDLKLPGVSGLTVLGSLKDNLHTRHIPVHVISVEDKSTEVRQMGAIGFLSKPANKKQLVTAMEQVEAAIASKAKNVLIVEDRKIERESIQNLIGNGHITSTAVESGEQAIEKLRSQVFDCMILDLTLPDISGFEVLERMGKDESIPRPPVIVYTGKDLSKEELEKIRQFSASIIIKGVKSEDRLFDEVTLFLHKVVADLPQAKQQILERVRHREEIFGGKRLLIVDDDMRNVFALRSVLSNKGFEIMVGKTGEEALAQLAAHPDIGIVLMDIMMPGMGGFETIKMIRKQSRFAELPIIALTAKAMKGDREKCLEAGANDYLSKPIDADNLLSLLRVWLSR